MKGKLILMPQLKDQLANGRIKQSEEDNPSVIIILFSFEFNQRILFIILCQMQIQRHQSEASDLEDNQHVEQDQQSKRYITDPQEYLDFCLKEKKIKVMDECNPIWNHVYLKDISLHKKGPLEDKIYAKIGKFYRNIRRGNTLCQIYHPNQLENKEQLYDLFFCRRGMKKFYDLEPEYLKTGANLSTHHRLMRARIFEDLDEQLEKGGAKIHLYRLFKENGQHCQVSFVRQLDCWLFASKNVAILAKNTQDLQQNYHKQRFYWAKLVAEQFFKYIQTFTVQQRQSFKLDIDGYTLLGEHCGNTKHQHITKYDKVQIIFYGLVKNVGSDHCQSVEQCRQFLTKYGLKMSSCIEKKNLVDKNTIYHSMWEMLKEVAEGTMAKEGEGSVMYIVSEREGQQRTIGMCKLKTAEYLIYRKLREMLKFNVARKGITANSFEKYKFEIEELVKHYFKPPRSLQFYFRMAERAFKQVSNNPNINEDYLRYKFVDFIGNIEQQEKYQQMENEAALKAGKPKRIIIVGLPRLTITLEKFCKAKGLEIDYMYRPGKAPSKTTIHILYMIPRLPAKLDDDTHLVVGSYEPKDIANCVQKLKESKDFTKSHLITFIKSEDKEKNIKMLVDKLDNFRKTLIEQSIPFKSVPVSNDQDLITAVNSFNQIESYLQTKPIIYFKQPDFKKYFILPMLIPGSGKTTLAKELLSSNDPNFEWKIIDSDAIRRELMEEISQVDLDCQSSQQLFFKTKDKSYLKFQQTLQNELLKPPTKNEYIYVDRIFSQLNLSNTISQITVAEKPYVKIVVLMQTNINTRLNDCNYPYSLNYLLTCLKRCLEREEHRTMSNNPNEVAKIVLKFYQMIANFNPKVIAKAANGNIKFIQVPFIEELEEKQYVNQNLKKKVEECLALIEPGQHPKEGNCFVELVELLYKFGEFKEESSLEKYSALRKELEKSLQSSN